MHCMHPLIFRGNACSYQHITQWATVEPALPPALTKPVLAHHAGQPAATGLERAVPRSANRQLEWALLPALWGAAGAGNSGGAFGAGGARQVGMRGWRARACVGGARPLGGGFTAAAAQCQHLTPWLCVMCCLEQDGLHQLVCGGRLHAVRALCGRSTAPRQARQRQRQRRRRCHCHWWRSARCRRQQQPRRHGIFFTANRWPS